MIGDYNERYGYEVPFAAPFSVNTYPLPRSLDMCISGYDDQQFQSVRLPRRHRVLGISGGGGFFDLHYEAVGKWTTTDEVKVELGIAGDNYWYEMDPSWAFIAIMEDRSEFGVTGALYGRVVDE